MNAEKKELERKVQDLERSTSRQDLNSDVRKLKEDGGLSPDFKIPADMDFNEAMKLVVKEAKKQALNEIRSEENQSKEEVKRYERMIDDGFDSLREAGHNITQKEEAAMLDLIQENNINIRSAADFQKVYNLHQKLKT